MTKKTNVLILNGIIAALYLVLTILVSPIASGPIQFRLSESLNHVVVFNKKLMWGVLSGVVLYNLFFSQFGMLDVLFGGGQTLLALTLTSVLQYFIHDKKKLLVANTLFFSGSMFMIAWMLQITIQTPFWVTFGWLLVSELIIMTLSAPVMYYIDKRVHF